MDDEGAHVADVREVADHLDRLDKARAGGTPAANAEAEHGAWPGGKIVARPVEMRVCRKAGPTHPRDIWMLFEVLRDDVSVLDMVGHAQWKGLESLQEEKRVHRSKARADVAELLHAQLRAECVLAEIVEEAQTAVAGDGLDHRRKVPVVPREPTRLDHDAADGGSVAAEEFRRGVHDDVRAVIEWAAQRRGCQCRVDYQRDARGGVRRRRGRQDRLSNPMDSR